VIQQVILLHYCKHRAKSFPPMGLLLIFNQSRSCKQLPSLMTHYTLRHFFIDCHRRTNTMPRCSSPRFAAKIYYYYYYEIKIVSTNIYGGTMPHNFEIYKILFFGPLFGVIFGLWGLTPAFWNSFVAWGLTTSPSPDVSTTFPDSFFMVIPKGLTKDPKSRLDRSCHIKIFYILHS